MGLDFNIVPSSDCNSIEYQNCSDYCVTPGYWVRWIVNYLSQLQKIGVKDTVNNTQRYRLYAGTKTNYGNTNFSYAWSFTDVVGSSFSGSSSSFVIDLDTDAINIITLTTTENIVGISSTTQIKISIGSSGELRWSISPMVIPSQVSPITLEVYFSDSSRITGPGITVDTTTDSLDPGDGSGVETAIPLNHTYTSSDVTRSVVYEFDKSGGDGVNITTTFQMKISTVNRNCTGVLSNTNITQVDLVITDPEGNQQAIDITTRFLNSPFDIKQTELTLLNLETPGIWKFETIVEETDGDIYIYSVCKDIILICDIRCQYSKLLAELVGLKLDTCLECRDLKLEQAITVGILIDGLVDHIGCQDTLAIKNAINLLETVLENLVCDC